MFDGLQNIYAYVNGNPVNKIDPLGLVDWDVSFANGSAGIDGTLLTATSPCVNGERVQASVGLIGAGIGIGVGGFTTGGFTISDNNSVPDPEVFNGTYLAVSTVKIVPIVGAQLGSIRVGGARSDYGWSMQFGLGAEVVGTAAGKSSVLQSSK